MDVIALARLAEAADGVAPLDEATLMTLRNHPARAVVWGDPRGFGTAIGSELSLVVMPHERGVGLGRRLLLQAPESVSLAWSHGDHPAAAALARSHGWERARELWVMRMASRGLDTASGRPDHQEGVTLRGFRPGDEAEILRVNAAAFAHHPEQGAMTLENLHERMAEPWFDPEGLVEAWDDATGQLLGFHWTKRHSPSLGEVYVVGVDPAAQGRRIGRTLTIAGLRRMADADEWMLYVDAENAPAVKMYEGLGFARTETHVQYRRS